MGDNPFLAMAGIDPAKVASVPNLSEAAAAAEQRYGLPSGLLSGIVHVESRGNPNAVSPKGAIGVAQLMPATARSLGVDPTDPIQSIDGAGRLMRENLSATNGNVTDALQMYHAGPDRSTWGPKTRAYPSLVTGAMGGPLDQQADASNPFLDMANGGSGASDVGAAVSPDPVRGDPSPSGGGAAGADSPGRGDLLGLPPTAGDRGGAGGAGGTPQSASGAAGRRQGLSDFGVGLARGITDVAGTIGTGIDKLGSATSLYHTDLQKQADAGQANLAKSQFDPNGWGSTIGRVGGDIAATLPLGEVKALQLLSPEARMAKVLASAGDAALQGGAAGALASGGHDVGEQAAIGAALGPVVSGAASVVTKGLLRAGEVANASRLAQTLRARAATVADDAGASVPPAPAPVADLPPLREGQTIRTGADMTAAPDATPSQSGNSYIGPDGLVVEVTGGKPAPDVAAMAAEVRKAALGSRGARTGLEADTNWPQAVADHVKALTDDGLPMDQAIREADITYIGGKPALAHTTRNPADQAAMWEGAKMTTPEGQALATQIANNNAAAHGAIQKVVSDLGGVPAEGAAAEGAARSLAKASDDARTRVNALYQAARETDGAAQADPSALRAVVDDPMNRAAVTNEGASFINGIGKRLDILTNKGETGLGSEALEAIRKAAGEAYQPVGGGEVNNLALQVKGAVDQGFDQLGEAGPAYAKARAAHREWASAYDDPAGIANLIARDNKGEFLNADAWRKAENFGGAASDKPFVQTVRQLRANGDQGSIDKLKAAVVQDAYEAATGTRGGNATDLLGNSTVNGKLFLDKLNAIGKPKLDALFSADEQGHLATLGRAAIALNEAVPGTVNTSGTASALANALRHSQAVDKKGGKDAAAHAILGIIGQGLGHVVAPGVGGVAAGAGLNAAKAGVDAAARRSAAKATASALRDASYAPSARATARTEAARMAAALRRRSTAHAIAARTPPVAAGSSQRRH